MTCFAAIVILTGCTSTKVSEHQEYQGEKIARPEHILVYDFVATPADMPESSTLTGQLSEQDVHRTAKEVAEQLKKKFEELTYYIILDRLLISTLMAGYQQVDPGHFQQNGPNT